MSLYVIESQANGIELAYRVERLRGWTTERYATPLRDASYRTIFEVWHGEVRTWFCSAHGAVGDERKFRGRVEEMACNEPALVRNDASSPWLTPKAWADALRECT